MDILNSHVTLSNAIQEHGQFFFGHIIQSDLILIYVKQMEFHHVRNIHYIAIEKNSEQFIDLLAGNIAYISRKFSFSI